MDIYADLPSANTKTDTTATGGATPGGASTSTASSSSSAVAKGSWSTAPLSAPAVAKGSWAHAKFQDRIAKRQTATAATSRMAPPPLVKRPGPASAGAKEKKEPPRPKPKPKASSQTTTPPQPVSNRPKSWDMGFGDIDDDYDPFQPNDYMEYCRERINRKKQEERDRELKIIMEEQEQERKRADEERAATIRKIQEAATKAHEAATAAGAGRGAGAAPGLGAGRGASGLGGVGVGDMAAMEASMGRGRGRGLSNLPAWMTKATGAVGAVPAAAPTAPPKDEGLQEPPTPGRRALPPAPGQFENAADGGRSGRFGPQMRGGGGARGASGGAAGEGPSGESGMNFAERMMAKMGHKEGMGLGASKQGISQPLQSMSAGGGMGVIDMHHWDKIRMGDSATPAPTARKKRGLFSNPTRVLLLKNMVGPGEVDDDLEGETQGECERFGPVRRCLIYEIKGGDTPETERVRIFVAFEKQESAVKAYLEMNGRFFGGRQIAASFYKEEKFDALELEPQPDDEKS